MKKKLFGILICTALLFSVNLTVYAQDTATQQEGTSQLPIGEEQDPNRPEEEVDNEPTKNIYKQYQVYCAENNLQPLSRIEFSRQVTRRFNYEIVDKKIDGKKYRVFQKRSD